jgi:hypothetical protein
LNGSKSAAQDSDSEEDISGLGDEDSENPLSLDPSSEDNILLGVDKVTFNFIASNYYFQSFFIPSSGKLFAQFVQVRNARKAG